MLTIFTPTYNRKYILPKLYESLISQTNQNFTWLIVDDGSADGTEELVSQWIKDNKIKIEYIKQENAGKMQAHNAGVLNAKTKYFVCVDSDDYVVDNAVETLLNGIAQIDGKDHICGIVAYRGKPDGSVLKTEFPKGMTESSLTDLYHAGFEGDATLLYRTEVLKKFLFPKIEGEKFITENYVYCQIDQEYKLLIIPEIVVICEYLDDGYSKNIYKVFNKNPKGMALYYNLKVKLAKGLIERLKFMAGYICYSKVAKNKHKFKNSNCKFCYIVGYPLGLFLYLKRKKYSK